METTPPTPNTDEITKPRTQRRKRPEEIDKEARLLLQNLLKAPPEAEGEILTEARILDSPTIRPEIHDAIKRVESYSAERRALLKILDEQAGHSPLSAKDLRSLQAICFEDKRIDEVAAPLLRSAPEPYINSPQYTEWCKHVFHEAFTREVKSLADFAPQRIIAGWRIIREMARTKGYIQPDQSLMEGLATSPSGGDPWIDPQPFKFATSDTAEYHTQLFSTNKNQHWRTSDQLIAIYLKTERETPEEFQAYTLVLEDIPPDAPNPDEPADSDAPEPRGQEWMPYFKPGLAMMPPSVPLPFFDPETQDALPQYDPGNPTHDPLLHAYINAVDATARHLYLELNSVTNPTLYTDALPGLTDPYLIRLCFPSRLQILALEAMLTEEALDLIVTQGIPETRKRLHRKYGFLPHETDQLCKLAGSLALSMQSDDLENQRAIMLLRLEDVARRSRDGLDYRAELAALKNIAIITGITKIEPSTILEDFVDVVKAAAEKRAMEASGGRMVLPTRTSIGSDPDFE